MAFFSFGFGWVTAIRQRRYVLAFFEEFFVELF